MKTVQAFECAYCGKLHKEESKLKACEKKCKKTKITAEEEKAQLQARQELRDYVRLNAESVEDICRMSEEVSEKVLGLCFIKKMTLNVRYTEHASNSHSAPIGELSNWERKADKPTGYPALTGNISVVYNKEPKGFGSEFTNHIAGIRTGSGGYRSDKDGYEVGYDVTLWLDDFPKIKQKVEETQKQIEVFSVLKTNLKSQYELEVDSDEEISFLIGEREIIEAKIRELQAAASAKTDKIYEIKREKYLNEKELTLKQEREKISDEFGLSIPVSTLIGFW